MGKKFFSAFGIEIFFFVLFSTSLISNKNIASAVKYDEEDAKAYLKKINSDVQVKTTESVLASWAYESNITDENLKHQLEVSAELANFTKELWKETVKYPWQTYKDPNVRRQFQKFSVLGTAILSAEKYDKYNKIVSEMQSVYGKAKVCNYHNRTDCSLQLEPELTEIFVNSRDPKELRYYWEEWRNAAGKPVRELYKNYVALSNEAAVMNNFSDNSEFWLKDYEAKDFKDQVETLWEQVKPLYLQLHAYVRRRLREQYGEEHVPKDGLIPAHLLGNMWAQSWGNIYNFSVPYPNKASTDVTDSMLKQGYTPLRMFKLAEEFFTSLNLSPMPETFWNNSILEKPKDGRDLICHASAWDFYDGEDFRIKQCTRVNAEDLNTVHHEMGHIQYFLQYKNQPLVYKEGTNPGFHEAIGDVMALSVSTPKHLKKIGLLNNTENDYEADINQLYNMALEKVAFLPFGFLMDQWRWSVFEGKTTEKNYNCKWWELREKYQGLSPSTTRTENDFDPGAKYHTIANVPYIRYFVSFIIQFQFHRALCVAANEYDPSNPTFKPLHQCDIYRSKEAGNLLKKMLQMGSSKPWPEAMEVLTGKRNMDASALLDYFATLKEWLEKENQKAGERVGWETTLEGSRCNSGETLRSSKSEGTVESDGIAYSYAEFVQRDDNIYGVPDYVEEAKPSYRRKFQKSKAKENSNKYDWLPDKLQMPNNKIEPNSDQPNQPPRVVSLSDLILLQKAFEVSKAEKEKYKKDISDEAELRKLRMYSPFEVKSKYNDIERNKILNVILQDLHNIKVGKVGKPVSQEPKDVVIQGPEKNSRLLQNKRNTKTEHIFVFLPVTKEKTKLKNEKVMRVSPHKLIDEIKGSQEEYAEKLPNDGQESLFCDSIFKPIKLNELSSKGEKANRDENDKKKSKSKNNEAIHKPVGDLMWESEMIKNGAEKILQTFNMTNQQSNNLPISQLPMFHQPLTEPNAKNSPKLPESIKLFTNILFTPRAQSQKDNADTGNAVKQPNSDSSKMNYYTGGDNKKTETLKKYGLIGVIPLSFSSRGNLNSGASDGKSGGANTDYGKGLEPNRKSRVEKKDNFIVLVGKLLNKKENSPKAKECVKKSYREYHYNSRNPIVYNAVILSSPHIPKPDFSNSIQSKYEYSKEPPLLFETPNSEKPVNLIDLRRFSENSNFRNRFFKNVRRKQINIKD